MRQRAKTAIREIEESKQRNFQCLISDGLIEILCCEPSREDVELLEKVFVKATPEFQKDILRALPVGSGLPTLVERLLQHVRCKDVARVAKARIGEASK